MRPSSKSQLLTLDAALIGALRRGPDERAYAVGATLPIANLYIVSRLTKRGWLKDVIGGWQITQRGSTAARRLLRRRS